MRDKLIDLWINKRSKAIQVIKNDGYWPQQNRVEIPMEETELYYEQLDKYVIEGNLFMQDSVVHSCSQILMRSWSKLQNFWQPYWRGG